MYQTQLAYVVGPVGQVKNLFCTCTCMLIADHLCFPIILSRQFSFHVLRLEIHI